MEAVPIFFTRSPTTLLTIGVGGAAFVLLLWLILMRRMVRRLFGRTQGARGAGLWLFLLSLPVAAFAAGALALCAALGGYALFTHRTHIAELQCIELDPGHLRLYYVPIEKNGVRGPTQTFSIDGDQFTVGGEIVRFRGLLTALGVGPAYAVTRVEGRWLSAADANRHKATAYDLGGGTSRMWLEAEQHGVRGPLGWLVAGAHGQAVSQLPDRRAIFDLYVTPTGYVLDKRGF